MTQACVERSAADVVDELRQFVHRAPMPLATTPRSTSFVPPRSVNIGECSRAMASRSRSRRVCADSAPTAVDEIGHQFHRLLLEAGAEILDQSGPVGGVLAVGQVARHRNRQLAQRDHAGHQVAHLGGRPVVDLLLGECADGGEHQRRRRQNAFRAAAFEAQLGGDLVPAVADLAEQVAVGDEGVGERHLVEVVFAVHQLDRADRDALRRRSAR